MGQCITMTGGGEVADFDALTAVPDNVLADKVFYGAGSDELQRGTMPNLTKNTPVNHSSANRTKVILGDEAYLSTNTDGVTRAEVRYNSEPGYIEGNTLLGVEQSKMASAIGLNSSKISAGNNILGIQGNSWTVWTGDVSQDDSKVLSGTNYWAFGQKRTGTMPNRGAGTKAISGGINNDGLFYYMPKGHWNPDNSGNSWTYLTRQEVANIIGLNGGNIRSGVNYCGVQGSMVDYSYLAVNQVPFDGASFSRVMAEGAEVCTSSTNDTMLRNVPEITSNGLRMYTSTATYAYPHLCPKKSIDFSPFREVRITGKFTGNSQGAGSFKVELWRTDVDKIRMLRNQATGALAYNSVSLDYANTEYTCVMDVSGVSGQAYLTVMFSNEQYLAWPNYYIKRIEFIT